MPSPLLARPSALLAKIESTRGTPETVSTADGIFNAFDVTMQETTAFIARPKQGGFGKLQGVLGAKMGTASVRFQLHGKGSAGPPDWALTFLQACGYINASGTFTRTGDTSLQKAITLVHFKGGGAGFTGSIKQTLCGSVGSWKITGRNGQPGDIIFDLKGKYWEEVSATQLDPTEPTVLPPSGYEAFQLGGTDVLAPEWTYDAGVSTLLLEGPNDANDTGYTHGICTDFNPTLAVEPYQELLATKDWRALFAASTEMALNAVIGSATNNTITLASSAMQIAQVPAFGTREGALTRNLTLNDNSANGAPLLFG